MLKREESQENYRESKKCFENARKYFSKISKSSKNLGVALCLAAESYLMSKKSIFLATKSTGENKLFSNALELLEQAKEIYKSANHIAG